MSSRILGWDTSFRRGFLVAAEMADGQSPSHSVIHAQILEVDQRQHSEGLLLGISRALEELRWKLPELSAIAVGIGPGSFTGIRIGLTTARTLGQMLGIPILVISSLELLENAYRHQHDADSGAVVVCTEACMGEVYCRVSLAADENAHEFVIKIAQLGDYLKQELKLSQAKTVNWVVSEALLAHSGIQPLLEESRGDRIGVGQLKNIPAALARLAGREFFNNKAVAPLEAHPVYLRASDAELKLRARTAAL